MPINSLNSTMQTNAQTKENSKVKTGLKIAAGVGSAALVLGGMYALGRTSPDFWVKAGEMNDGKLIEKITRSKVGIFEGIKAGVKRLPNFTKSLKNIVTDKTLVIDGPSKGDRIKDLLHHFFVGQI